MAEMTQEEYDRLKMTWAVQNGQTSSDSVAGSPEHVYNLFNVDPKIRRVLCYQSRSGDTINLGWALPGEAFHVRFTKQDGSDGPITFGEPIAFSVVRGGYVRYQRGRDGINLGWDKTPVFEWSFVGEPDGEPVRIGSVVGLHNSVEDDCLFYDERTNGINLKWVRDKGKFAGWVKFKNIVSTVTDAYKDAKEYF